MASSVAGSENAKLARRTFSVTDPCVPYLYYSPDEEDTKDKVSLLRRPQGAKSTELGHRTTVVSDVLRTLYVMGSISVVLEGAVAHAILARPCNSQMEFHGKLNLSWGGKTIPYPIRQSGYFGSHSRTRDQTLPSPYVTAPPNITRPGRREETRA